MTLNFKNIIITINFIVQRLYSQIIQYLVDLIFMLK